MADNEIPTTPATVIPQPAFGIPTSQNLELTEFLTKPHTFEYDPENPDDILDGYIPPEMKKFFWGYINPDIVLTRLAVQQVESVMYSFKADRVLFLSMTPKYKKTRMLLLQLNQLERYVYYRLLRSLDGRERELLNTQTQQQIYGTVSPPAATQSRGLLSGIRDRLFGRGGVVQT